MIRGQTRGVRSSEFLLTLLGMCGGILCAIFSESQWSEICGTVLAMVCGASYSQSRATVKRALASAEAVASVGKSPED